MGLMLNIVLLFSSLSLSPSSSFSFLFPFNFLISSSSSFSSSDIDAPISQGSKNDDDIFVDASKVDTLLSFGFQEEIARKALKASVIRHYHLILCEANAGVSLKESSVLKPRYFVLFVFFSSFYCCVIINRAEILRKPQIGSLAILLHLFQLIWVLCQQVLQGLMLH